MNFKPSRWLPPIAGAVLLAAALYVLHGELKALHYRQVHHALKSLSAAQFLLALLFTALNYAVLTGYDQLAFSWLGRKIARRRIALAAFTGQAVANNVGFSLLSGTSIRHRFYSRWGVAPSNLVRVVLFFSTTFWLGLLALGGWMMAFRPPAPLTALLPHAAPRLLGFAMMGGAALYLALSLLRTPPVLRLRGFELRLPKASIAFPQLILSMGDWALAAAVLHALLPAGGPSYTAVLGAFLGAQILGVISFIPGGLGVFEGAILVLLGSGSASGSTGIASPQIVSALILFRLIYYVLPLVVAVCVLLADEIRQRRESLATLGRVLGSTSAPLAPKALSVLVFLAGTVLLVSGATPSQHARLHWMAQIFPVGLFEASHFIGSILGVCLLVLAQAIGRRIRAAYQLVLVGLTGGVAVSLLKGGDWEEALLLALLLLLFVPAKEFFDRRAALFDTRFSKGWIIAIAAAAGASIWLGLFSFRHVEYSSDLWWRFALDHDAPRFLRAAVGVSVTLIGFALWRLFRPRTHVIHPPSDADLADAERVIASQPDTLPFLAYLRDKGLMFNKDRTAFLMYGVRGRTWVALGDPVGPAEAAPRLIRAFIERADNYGGVPVFYQIHASHLYRYADLGMTFAKLGEEGSLDLIGFTLEGGRNRDLRNAVNRLAREQVTFRVAEPEEVPALLPALKAVSDAWLADKAVSEKGFSLGSFDPEYLARLPVALLERKAPEGSGENEVVAFANLLCGAGQEELSIDLMRFGKDAPHGAMDALFAHIFLWGSERGYRHFNLGMAPLSGLHPSRRSPLWARLGSFIYRHGEAFYNFEGLRAYKEKFHPEWKPRYLAYPGGFALPVVLADIAALSAGGYKRIFK